MTPIENLKRRLIAEHGYKPSTEKGYVRVAERFLEHMATKAKDITQITQADVEEFRDLMANETVSKRRTGGYGMRDPASVARETAALNKFLSVLGKKDLKLKLTKVPIKELRIPTDDEVDAMIRAASENEDEFLSKRNVLILMLLADVRTATTTSSASRMRRSRRSKHISECDPYRRILT
jgi:integrase